MASLGFWADKDLTKEDEVVSVWKNIYDSWEIGGERLQNAFKVVLEKLGWSPNRIKELERNGALRSKWSGVGWESLSDFKITCPNLGESIRSNTKVLVSIVSGKQLSVLSHAWGSKLEAKEFSTPGFTKRLVVEGAHVRLKKVKTGYLVVAEPEAARKVHEVSNAIIPKDNYKKLLFERIAGDLILGSNKRSSIR